MESPLAHRCVFATVDPDLHALFWEGKARRTGAVLGDGGAGSLALNSTVPPLQSKLMAQSMIFHWQGDDGRWRGDGGRGEEEGWEEEAQTTPKRQDSTVS